MSSVPRPDRPDEGDLTARARIRDAALLQFAERGFNETTIRAIAEAAGVSSGLVQYHYRSKEALREACDRYAFDFFRQTKNEAHGKGQFADPNFLSIAFRTSFPVLRYLARALADGSASAAELFDELVEYTQDALWAGMPGVNPPPDHDREGLSAVLTAMQLGVLVLHPHLTRVLGSEIFSAQTYPRLVMALLDIHSHSLVTPETAAQARAGLAHVQAVPPTAEE